MLTEAIRDEICRKAKRADSPDEVADILCDVLVSAQIDRSTYTLDEIKTLLVDALVAYRSERKELTA